MTPSCMMTSFPEEVRRSFVTTASTVSGTASPPSFGRRFAIPRSVKATFDHAKTNRTSVAFTAIPTLSLPWPRMPIASLLGTELCLRDLPLLSGFRVLPDAVRHSVRRRRPFDLQRRDFVDGEVVSFGVRERGRTRALVPVDCDRRPARMDRVVEALVARRQVASEDSVLRADSSIAHEPSLQDEADSDFRTSGVHAAERRADVHRVSALDVDVHGEIIDRHDLRAGG